MYDKETGYLYFPHLIPGKVLGGKEHAFNDIHGGMKKIEDFTDPWGNPYERNTFFGGRVESLGFIKDYGFYACVDAMSPKHDVIGFYVNDGKIVTDEGKELLQKRFPSATILWDSLPPPKPTQDDIDRKNALLREAVELGHSPESLHKVSIPEMEGLVKAWKSGKKEGATGNISVSDGVVRPFKNPDEPDVVVKKVRGMPRELA